MLREYEGKRFEAISSVVYLNALIKLEQKIYMDMETPDGAIWALPDFTVSGMVDETKESMISKGILYRETI